MNVPLVITRAISEIHKDILKLIGADQVILPEQEIGIKLADTLSAPYAQLLRITPNFGIGQLIAPQKFVNRSIADLNLGQKYSVHCIGLQIADEEIVNIKCSQNVVRRIITNSILSVVELIFNHCGNFIEVIVCDCHCN